MDAAPTPEMDEPPIRYFRADRDITDVICRSYGNESRSSATSKEEEKETTPSLPLPPHTHTSISLLKMIKK